MNEKRFLISALLAVLALVFLLGALVERSPVFATGLLVVSSLTGLAYLLLSLIGAAWAIIRDWFPAK